MEREITADVLYDQITKRRAYSMWKQSIAVRQHQLSLSIRFELHLERKLMVRSFEYWQQRYQDRKLGDYAKEYHINKTLQTYMLRWKIGSVVEAESNKSKIASFRKKWDPQSQTGMKRRCLVIWKSAFKMSTDLKSRICQFRTRRDIKRITSTYGHWKSVAVQSQHQRSVMTRCTVQLTRFRMSYFLDIWMHSVVRRQDVDEIERVVTSNHQRNSVRSAFDRWKGTVMANNARFEFELDAL